MRQRIYDCNGHATFWARTRPGQRNSLLRSLERALDYSEGKELIYEPLINTFHSLSNDLHEPPLTYRQWLDWIESPYPDSDLKSSISNDDLIYESSILTNSRVKEVTLPSGLVYLGSRRNNATEAEIRQARFLGKTQAFSDPEDEPYF